MRIALIAAGFLWASTGLAGPADEFAATLAAAQWVIVLDDSRAMRRTGWAGGQGYRSRRPYQNDPALKRRATDFARQFSLTVVKQWPLRSLRAQCVVVEAATERTEAVLRALLADDRVRWVQPFQNFDGATLGVRNNNEPLASIQHAYRRLNLPSLALLDGTGIKVVVIDSAVDNTHPELRRAVRSNRDFVQDSARGTRSGEQHGTGMAAVIAAHATNAHGIAGVAPGAELHALRACWDDADRRTRCDTLSLSMAIEHAASLAPDILNLSLSGPPDRLLETLLDPLLAGKTLVVAAHDEARAARARFPRLRPGVIIARNGTAVADVAGTDALFALATDVPTALPGNRFGAMSGHSLAAAQLSGVIALLEQRATRLTAERLAAALAATTASTAEGTSVDVCAALTWLDRADVCRAPSVREADRNDSPGSRNVREAGAPVDVVVGGE